MTDRVTVALTVEMLLGGDGQLRKLFLFGGNGRSVEEMQSQSKFHIQF